MLISTMIEDHIHDYFQPFTMRLLHQVPEFLVASETTVYLIIVGNGISMIGPFFHIIFLNRIEPYTRHSQIDNIIQMIFYSFQVTTMACKRIVAVYFSFQHSGNYIIRRITISKAVWHDEIKYVTGIETFHFGSRRSSLFKFVGDYSLLFTLFQDDFEFLWGCFRSIHV